jgi:hypothetical protein
MGNPDIFSRCARSGVVRKGTAVQKKYQKSEIETSAPAVPETVRVALAELAGQMREGLLALVVGAGLLVMAAIMEEDATAVCGPKGHQDPERTAIRHGYGPGSVTLGGRRVPVARPRMRAVDGSGAAGTGLRAVLRHRGHGTDGDGTNAGRAVHPPLRCRARIGWHKHRAGCHGHLALGGVAPVHRGDRDRPGRAARCGPVQPGPGRVDG